METTLAKRATPSKRCYGDFFSPGITVDHFESSPSLKKAAQRTTIGGITYCGDNVIADINAANGNVVRSYVTPMLDSNVSMTVHTATPEHPVPPTTFYYNADERMSVRNLTDSSGAVVNGYEYTAYGDKVDYGTSGTVMQRYTYTGRELNETSNNYYFRYRMYGAGLGGFLSRDQLEYVDGMSMYSGYFAMLLGIDPEGFALKELPLKDGVALKNALGLTDLKPGGADSGITCKCICDTAFKGSKAEKVNFRYECSFKASIQILMLHPKGDDGWITATKGNEDFYERLGKKGWEQGKELSEAIKKKDANAIYDAVLKHEQQHYKLYVNWYKNRQQEVNKYNKKNSKDKNYKSCDELEAGEGKNMEKFKTEMNDDFFEYSLWQEDRVHGNKNVNDPVPAYPMTRDNRK